MLPHSQTQQYNMLHLLSYVCWFGPLLKFDLASLHSMHSACEVTLIETEYKQIIKATLCPSCLQTVLYSARPWQCFHHKYCSPQVTTRAWTHLYLRYDYTYSMNWKGIAHHHDCHGRLTIKVLHYINTCRRMTVTLFLACQVSALEQTKKV